LRRVDRYEEIAVKATKSWKVMIGEYTALAFLLPSATFVGYIIGYLLDKLFHTHFLYVVFLIIGIAAGFRDLVRRVTKDE
jgi:F0F1-type ATP synthase assembly protein I